MKLIAAAVLFLLLVIHMVKDDVTHAMSEVTHRYSTITEAITNLN